MATRGAMTVLASVATSSLVFVACSTHTSEKPKAETEAGRPVLSEGYALLYERASDLRKIDKLVVVKSLSDDVANVLRHIAASTSRIGADLESIATRYPSIHLDRTGLPEVERRAREEMSRQRRSDSLPLVGKSGKEFERELLLDQLSALDQQRNMTKVMIELETSDDRKAALERAHRSYEELYGEVEALLRRRFFR